MSPNSVLPPPTVKHILKRLNKKPSPMGAKSILQDMNYNPNVSIQQAAISSMRLKKGGKLLSRNTQNNNGNNENNGQNNGENNEINGENNNDNGNNDEESNSPGIGSQSSGSNFYSSITPWTEEIYTAANNLNLEVQKRRKELSDSRQGPPGKKGPSGRMDYRANCQEHPVMCVDGKKAYFLDDAFSISPETGEVLVHIVDVVGTLRRHELLQSTARDRISSTFLPSG